MEEASQSPALNDARQLLEAMTDGVIVQNAAGEVVSSNASALRILGLSEREMRGRLSLDPRWRTIREDGTAVPVDEYPTTRALRLREPQRGIVVGIHKADGSLTWIAVDAQPLIGPDGRLYGAVTTIHDLTQRREAEERMRRSIAALSDLYNNAPCGYHSINREGVFVRMNDTELRWLGYARKDVIGRMRVTDIMTPRSVETFKELFPRLMREGTVADLEVQLVTKSGTVLETVISATVLRDSSGEFLMTRSTVFNNTHRKQVEAEMRRLNLLLEERVQQRTAALSEALSELEAFASSVSHDLRSPVRTIDAFSRMLREDAASQLSAEGREFLERIAAANRRQAQLIGDLLNLSRIFTATLSETSVDLSGLAHAVVDELRHADPERHVDVAIAADLTVHADAGLMRSVMENLLGNSWKFTANSSAARIEVGAQQQDDTVRFFVRDNGVGFNAAGGADVFQPFRRMHASDEFPGTGIGLATVARIIKRHHGRIWVESAPGAGTTVFFEVGVGNSA